jgi:aldehyde dehydrogenase (NAD+)
MRQANKQKLSAQQKAALLSQLSVAITGDRKQWQSTLLEIETQATVNDEIDKTVNILAHFDKEIPLLVKRNPLGLFRVCLPYNNPIYSLILYCCGLSLAGNSVVVRPSRLTHKYVSLFYYHYKEVFDDLDIALFEGSGYDLITAAYRQKDGGLLFTGKWDNILDIKKNLPKTQRLIYCGQGINPFVIGSDHSNLETAVDLLIKSRIYNSGQDCLCAERIYVHHDVVESFQEILCNRLSSLKVGSFLDDQADIFPPLGEISDEAFAKLERARRSESIVFDFYNELAPLAVIKTNMNSALLNIEKFCCIFVFSEYCEEDELKEAADSKFLFGATVTAGAELKTWQNYPHLTTERTVIETESDDAHVPFGGRQQSGFSCLDGEIKDGPILFSLESSIDETRIIQ